MLDEIPSERGQRIVFRLSREPAGDDQFLASLDLDPEASDELLNTLSDGTPRDPILELLDGPFRPRTKLRNATRFSDGSFPVFYSALALETAETEVAYWFRRSYAGKPQSKRTAYYQGFRCAFEGLEKDLRSKVLDWPDLMHDSNYSLCNRLGAEARDRTIDGLVVPSVRHEGANMPIFTRQAVSDPKLEGMVAITLSPETGEVSVDSLSQD